MVMLANNLPADLVAEVAKLRRENHQLRVTNELLKAASLFHIGTRPKTSEMILFVDEHRERFCIEFTRMTSNTHLAGDFKTFRGNR